VLRFVCITWNASDPLDEGTANSAVERLRGTSGMNQVLGEPGVAVFVAGVRSNAVEVHRLSGGQGVVLGTLFRRDDSQLVRSPNGWTAADASERIAAHECRGLVQDFWGRYVAILRPHHSSTVRVIRAPAGSLPCFSSSYGRLRLFFSRIFDVLPLGLIDINVDWLATGLFLIYPHIAQHRTGLAGVVEILPGECIELSRSKESRLIYWDPRESAFHDPIRTFEEAIKETRRRVLESVGAWASCSDDGIIHLLSGGLDSGVVLSALRRTSPDVPVTCLNYSDPSNEGDERKYARMSASAEGCDLIEHFQEPHSVDLRRVLGVLHPPRPDLYAVHLIHGEYEALLAHERRAHAIFGGGGGDQLFFIGAHAYAAIDYAFEEPFGTDHFSIALDVARVARISVWSALRRSISNGILRRPIELVPSQSARTFFDRGFLAAVSESARAAASGSSIPVGKRLPPGKEFHAQMMLVPQNYYSPLNLEGTPEPVHPLITQPLIELFLRIRTAVLCHRGHDRAVEKSAFADLLPEPILRRRDKGGISTFLIGVLRRNESFVREFLLDGFLVKDRILNREEIERFFSQPYSVLTPGALDIVDNHVSLEAWYRYWIAHSGATEFKAPEHVHAKGVSPWSKSVAQ
jgi:asparagine synthase (glutamine-hydrolysing)